MLYRSIPRPVELNTRDLKPGSAGNLSGYIAVFNSDSVDMGGGCLEQIEPTAFKTLAKNDVVALFNHNYDRVAGRVSAGTLSLKTDDKGLFFDLDVPDTTDGRDSLVLVERGDLIGCSFGFKLDSFREEDRDGVSYCILESIDLYEVSICVTFPAYPETSMTIRGMLNEKHKEDNLKAKAYLRLKLIDMQHRYCDWSMRSR